MKITELRSCYIGPEISPEQFISEHFFLYIVKGKIHGYDGHSVATLSAGQYALVRKNHLARYNKERTNGEFEKIVIIFDETFLKSIPQGLPEPEPASLGTAFIPLSPNESIPVFMESLVPYYDGFGRIAPAVANEKRRELLYLLLQNWPELRPILWDFSKPDKIDLEAFMQRNYKFNVSIERFAYLTGRSRSSFKRDFKALFLETPNRWLTSKRLQEAYFLITKKHQKPNTFYLELGFQDLSHFSFAFKKAFGQTPTSLWKQHFPGAS